jgi:hypothetical protein
MEPFRKIHACAYIWKREKIHTERQPLSVKLKIKLLACSSRLSKKLYQNVRGGKVI